jgi:leader peptidase (prepilin peptidase)/N-methyltransferase
MVETFMNMIMGVLLLVCGVQDALKKKIFIWVIGLGAVLIGVCMPFSDTITMLERIGGVAVGAVIIIISKATEGKIGLGDGFLLCVTGLGLGFWGNIELIGVALFFAAIVSIALLVFRLADRKKSIPFVPFMLLGYVVLLVAK